MFFYILSLEELLSSRLGQSDVFISNDDLAKKAILECLLEGRDGLITSILDSIQRVSHIPKTQYRSLLFSVRRCNVQYISLLLM